MLDVHELAAQRRAGVEARVTQCDLEGPPPEPFASWRDAMAAMLSGSGVPILAGLRIQALDPRRDP